MHVNDALRARLLVQGIDVLGAKEKPLSEPVLQFRQGTMGSIGQSHWRDAYAARNKTATPIPDWHEKPQEWPPLRRDVRATSHPGPEMSGGHSRH